MIVIKQYFEELARMSEECEGREIVFTKGKNVLLRCIPRGKVENGMITAGQYRSKEKAIGEYKKLLKFNK